MITRPATSLPVLLAAIVGLLLGGCVSAPNVDLDAAHRSTLHRIALLGIPEPAQVQVANIGGAAGAFGIIGGLAQAASNNEHAKGFTAALRQQHVAFAPQLAADLTRALEADGYVVVDAHDQHPKLAADRKSDDFSGIHVNADAILAVWYTAFGYVSQPMSTHYQPWIVVKARLLNARTKKDLYDKTFMVGWRLKIKNAIYVPADPKFQFKWYTDVMAHVTDAANGLLDSQALVANRIGADLKPATD